MIFSATKAVLRCVDKEVLTSGMQQAVKCVFSFSRDWDGLGKTAVFICGGVQKDMVVDNNQVIIPHEALVAENIGKMLRVGVYGIDGSGNVVIPTIMCSVGEVLKGADPFGDHSADPTPSIWEQMLADNAETRRVAAEERQATEDARDDAVEAKDDAETARQHAEAAKGGAEDAQAAAEDAQQKAEDAQEAAELAQTAAESAKTDAEAARNRAEAAQTAAETAQSDAEAAQTAAETAKGAAETARDAAAGSAAAAAGSQSAAAASASSAANSASAAAGSASTAGTKATEAGNSATAAAQSQSAAAGSASAAAQSAASAQQAKEAIEALQALANTLTPGSTATVTKTVDPQTGVVTLAFGIPRGDTGATPRFSVGTIETGEPGSAASVTITGTAENPVLNMSIPAGVKGDTGNGIDRIEKTATAGVIDTYTVYYTDGTTWTYQVANSSEASADRITYFFDDPHPAGYVGNAINDLQLAFDLILTWVTHKEADWEPRIADLEENAIKTVKRNGTALPVSGNAVDISVPTKTSDLTNDDNTVKDANYVHTDNNFTDAQEENITKLLSRTDMVSGTVTLVNSLAFPFNNSQVTVPIAVERDNQDYIVDYEVTAAVGNVGDIIVSAKLVNGFKIEHTGSASSVTVKYQVLGGMA